MSNWLVVGLAIYGAWCLGVWFSVALVVLGVFIKSKQGASE